MSAFAAYLRQSMTSAGYNVSSLSRAIGVARPTVHTWLSGTNRPHGENVHRLARALLVPPEEVYAAMGVEPVVDPVAAAIDRQTAMLRTALSTLTAALAGESVPESATEPDEMESLAKTIVRGSRRRVEAEGA